MTRMEAASIGIIIINVYRIQKMEICVDSIESAENATQGGAKRLEVCSALSEGGLTPTPGLLRQIKKSHKIPVYTMIRIRSGNFVYTRDEMDAMLFDLATLKSLDADGFVFGALTEGDEIDADYCKEIISAAKPLPVTFHRAFDEVREPMEALETIIGLGFERVLTSGGRNTAEGGLETIRELVQRAADRISVMPGSGVTRENILKIKHRSGAKEFHASAKKMKSQGGTKCRMGSEKDSQSGIIVADVETVRAMVDSVTKDH